MKVIRKPIVYYIKKRFVSNEKTIHSGMAGAMSSPTLEIFKPSVKH